MVFDAVAGGVLKLDNAVLDLADVLILEIPVVAGVSFEADAAGALEFFFDSRAEGFAKGEGGPDGFFGSANGAFFTGLKPSGGGAAVEDFVDVVVADIGPLGDAEHVAIHGEEAGAPAV